MTSQLFAGLNRARLAAGALAAAALLAAGGCSAHKNQETQRASAIAAPTASKTGQAGSTENQIVADIAAVAAYMADPTRPLPRDAKQQVAAGVFPSDMVQNGAVKDAWGNPVSLQSGGGGTGFQAILEFGGAIGKRGNTETAAQCADVARGVMDQVKVPSGDYMAVTIDSQHVSNRADALRTCGSKGGGEITVTIGGQY